MTLHFDDCFAAKRIVSGVISRREVSGTNADISSPEGFRRESEGF